MKRTAQNIIKFRYLIFGFFLAGAILSFTLIDNVKINYDNSKYLPQESVATTDMNYINEEIEIPSSISLMIEGITIEDTNSLINSIQTIDGIELVLFDESNGNFVNQNALMTLLLSNDVTDVSVIIDDIENALSSHNISISGEAANLHYQEQRLIEETPIALLVSGFIILIILLLTTRSYFEPLVFGVVIGISIVINLGTNIMFSEISYITKSVAAILQLGLSMDYSIMLLHSYYHEKDNTSNNRQAMANAITNSAKSIASSSFTTTIGLLALVFMTFTIGTDIGLVLAKGIIISLISVFLLLPNLILLIEKIPFNKTHKTIDLSRFSLRKSSKKFSLTVTITAALFICAMFLVQTNNSYTFYDATKYDGEESIKEVFGSTNTFVVGLDKNDSLIQNEEKIINKINLKYDNKITSYLGVSNSISKLIDYSYLTSMTSAENSKFIFALYALDHSYDYSMTYEQYINTLEILLEERSDINQEDIAQLVGIITLNNYKGNAYTVAELSTILDNMGILTNSQSNNSLLDTLYGLYSYDNNLIENKNISPILYLNVLQLLGSDSLSIEQQTDLNSLITSLTDLTSTLSTSVTTTEFQFFLNTTYGIPIDTPTVDSLYSNYFLLNQLPVSDSITIRSLFTFIVENQLLDEAANTSMLSVLQLENIAVTETSKDVMKDTVNTMILSSDPLANEFVIDDSLHSIVFTSSLSSLHRFTDVSIPLSSFLSYTTLALSNPNFSGLIDDDTKVTLDSINAQVTLLNQVTPLSLSEITTVLSPVPNTTLTDLSKVIYASSLSTTNQLDSYTVEAQNLITYVSSSQLIPLSTNEVDTIGSLQTELTTINNMITSDNVSLLVINTTFEHESKLTEEFVAYMYNEGLSDLEGKSYFIGHSVSNIEIKEYFEQDLLKINFITIGAILIILIITFQSFIIPFILVFIIEGAIWTTLSVSYILGQDIFFISYIIIGAIQLGATIDYAIVLTNNYQNARKQTDKKNAITLALQKTTPTILTSGLILIIAGLSISIISSQATVASIGNFISRGTVISVIAVLVVLPSFLYTLDSFILKHDKAIIKVIKK